MAGIFGGGSDDDYGQPRGFGGMSNSLIGMGMGLLQPRMWYESPMAGALQGWQAGAAMDQRTAQQRQQMAIERARLGLAQQQANREPETIRLLRAAGIDPTSPEGRDVLFPKQSAVREGKVTYRDQEYPYQVDQRGNVKWLLGPPPGYGAQTGAGSSTLGPQNPVVPGTTLYWPDQQSTAAPSTAGAGTSTAAGAIPPPPAGLENEPWSVQKAVRQKQLEAEFAPKPPPAGYEWIITPDGRRVLSPIEGGPATHLPAETAGRLALVEAAKPGLEDAKKYFLDPKSLGEREMSGAGSSLYSYGKQAIGQVTGSFEIGRQRRNIKYAIEAALRTATGAAAPESEVERYTEMYTPGLMDNYATRKQKIDALDRFLDNTLRNVTQGRVPAGRQPPPSGSKANDPMGLR